MLIVVNEGQTPILYGNTEADGVVPFLRRDFPEAAIYACAEPGSYNRARAHEGATTTVYTDRQAPNPEDPEGEPVTVTDSALVPVGNTLTVDHDGPALVLLGPDGQEVSRLPLTAA